MSDQRRAKFPVYSLAIGVVLSVVSVGTLIWFSYLLHEKFHRMMTTVQESSALVEQIRYYDEVLTMSAGMSAWTGNPSWKERYDRAADSLDKVFENLRRVAPAEMSDRLMAQTSTANDRLIEMETRSFQLVEQGRKREAWDVLQSDAYKTEKNTYKAGIDEFIAEFGDYMAQIEAAQWQSVMWNTGLGLAGLLVVLMSWLATFRVLNRFHRENRRFQEGLEGLVRERTQELSTEIDERKRAQKELHDAYEVITSSIRYAARIQRAVLPDDAVIGERLSDYFILWEPRDTVGGDIYWCGAWGDSLLVILGDCTGHGVPGAFMTLISIGALERAKQATPDGDLEALIGKMHALLKITLGQHQDGGGLDDGIELGACLISRDQTRMDFVGARFSLFRVGGEGVDEIKGIRQGLAYRSIPLDQSYTGQTIALEPGQAFFMTSDGMIEQLGGAKGLSFGKKRFMNRLLELRDAPMAQQKEAILQSLLDYQGKQSRRDDVSVIGFRI